MRDTIQLDSQDLKEEYEKGYSKAIDEVLEIIKKNPLFPASQSQKLFLLIRKLKENKNGLN